MASTSEPSSHEYDDDEKVFSNSDSGLINQMEELQSKCLDLTNKLRSEMRLVKKFREESAIYKSSVNDLEESMSEEKKASDLTIKTLTSNLTELQTTHDTLISVHEDFKIKFHMLSKERVELFKKIKELEEINLKRGQSEQSLSLLTQNLNENHFTKRNLG